MEWGMRRKSNGFTFEPAGSEHQAPLKKSTVSWYLGGVLVTCPECGQKISEWADPCPKCGYPSAGAYSEERLRDLERRLGGIKRLTNNYGAANPFFSCTKTYDHHIPKVNISIKKGEYYWDDGRQAYGLTITTNDRCPVCRSELTSRELLFLSPGRDDYLGKDV
jgi:hypothetical protein